MAGSSKNNEFKAQTELVKELTTLFTENELTELELETETLSLRLAKTAEQTVVAAQPVLAPQPAAAPPQAASEAPTAGAVSEAAAIPADAVKSPMVGTAYLAPEPGAADFVSVGDKVSKGQTLCIIEAMKVMNPIASPCDGTVREILVENAQPVEFDQPIFVVS